MQKIYERGAKGGWVATFQIVLNAMRLPPGKAPLEVDGKYGKLTDERVEDFQRANPPLKVDGDIGPNTMARLRLLASTKGIGWQERSYPVPASGAPSATPKAAWEAPASWCLPVIGTRTEAQVGRSDCGFHCAMALARLEDAAGRYGSVSFTEKEVRAARDARGGADWLSSAMAPAFLAEQLGKRGYKADYVMKGAIGTMSLESFTETIRWRCAGGRRGLMIGLWRFPAGAHWIAVLGTADAGGDAWSLVFDTSETMATRDGVDAEGVVSNGRLFWVRDAQLQTKMDAWTGAQTDVVSRP